MGGVFEYTIICWLVYAWNICFWTNALYILSLDSWDGQKPQTTEWTDWDSDEDGETIY